MGGEGRRRGEGNSSLHPALPHLLFFLLLPQMSACDPKPKKCFVYAERPKETLAIQVRYQTISGEASKHLNLAERNKTGKSIRLEGVTRIELEKS